MNPRTVVSRQATTPRWVLLLLAALVAVLTILGLAGTASATTAPAAQDRVGSTTQNPTPLVGPPQHIAAGQRLGQGRSEPGIVVATGVAADTAADEFPELSASRSQLEAKFKHAADFGVADSRGAAGFDAYGKAVDSFVNDSSTVRVAGTYRGNAAIMNYNATSRLVVVQGTDGSFISGWHMSQAQLQNVMTRGSLGGG